MKLAMITAALFLNATAFAYPSVGDNAVYTITQSAGGQSIKAEMKVEITTIDQALDQVTLATTINGMTQASSTNSYSELATMFNQLSQCTNSGGKLENIQAAGQTFQTCHMHQEFSNGAGPIVADYWFGKVPFGIVKSETKNTAYSQTTILKSFKMQ